MPLPRSVTSWYCGEGLQAELARQFIAFLASPAGQKIITGYGRKAYGQPLYKNAAQASGAH